MGALADAAGLFGEPDDWTDDVAPERLRALAVVSAQFLRAGGSLTIQDFARLSQTERAVLAVCADELRGVNSLPTGPVDIQSVLADFMEGNNGG